MQVVLLGLYNGQRLENEPAEDMVSYSRVLEGPKRSFVRVLLLRGRVQGAVMIGETGEEGRLAVVPKSLRAMSCKTGLTSCIFL